MKTEKPIEAWAPQRTDILQALKEFVPVMSSVALEDTELEDAIPVSTPNIDGLPFAICVYAPFHQDLSHSRYSILAPIILGHDAVLSVKQDGQVIEKNMLMNELVILDSHLPHSLSRPKNWPTSEDMYTMSLEEKTKLKRQNMSVFLNLDYMNRPTREQVEADICRMLHLPSMATKKKHRMK